VLEKRWQELAVSMVGTTDKLPDLDALDKKADTQIRFAMFRLAVHYWEANWLIECKALGSEFNDLIRKTGEKTVVPRWRRRMMLTPCIVSTFHTLPYHMICKAFNEGHFDEKYMFNFIDLLIVDEAGQVSPEVGGASFSLAKKALVIGDTLQIEPVRSLTGEIDIGNLVNQALIRNNESEEYAQIQNTGRSVVNGSVMHIAQSASRYHYQPEMQPGMFLREHRRCFKEIISFCNDLCYQGVLEPKRGNAKKNPVFPPFGYLHIDGRAEQRAGGSRFNALEAETIACWLQEKRLQLEAEFGDALENIVGIVTPFSAQVYEIQQACYKKGIKTGKDQGELTVGTVHALQGAARKVVIFSPVYSRHHDGGFIDGSASMLNVAVSRAKDSFLVFGDMDVIAASPASKPRGVLAKYLFKDKRNELIFALQKRKDLLARCGEPKLINNADEHDKYLLELLAQINDSISIVSPWIKLAKLQQTGLLDALASASRRNVKVHCYTDRHFNTTIANKFSPEKEKEFISCCEHLASLGISVSVIRGVHSKLIMADDCHVSVGSFNWFSAARNGPYANMEASFIYTGELENEIKIQTQFLRSRVHKTYGDG